MKQARLAVVIGTRPEAIKLAPVIWACRAHPALDPIIVVSGQHRELLSPCLADLGLVPDCHLDTMGAGGDLAGLTARLINALTAILKEVAPDAVVVQGDTTTAMTAALAAFYEKIPTAHVEAGLRSGSLADPFPEELNRRMIAVAARWHFAPTDRAAASLRSENIPAANIDLVGNTVIDTLQWARRLKLGRSAFAARSDARMRVLVTLHRRETQGEPMAALGEAVARVAATRSTEVVLPLHKSPAVRAALVPALSGRSGVRLCEPLGYLDFLATLAEADLLITDSGGVLEEACGLGVPTLICRETTERPEAVEAGTARLIGVEAERLVSETLTLLDDPVARAEMTAAPCPFGDGRAAPRIAARLAQCLVSPHEQRAASRS